MTIPDKISEKALSVFYSRLDEAPLSRRWREGEPGTKGSQTMRSHSEQSRGGFFIAQFAGLAGYDLPPQADAYKSQAEEGEGARFGRCRLIRLCASPLGSGLFSYHGSSLLRRRYRNHEARRILPMLVGNRVHDAEIKKNCARDNFPAHGAWNRSISLMTISRPTAILEMIIRPPDADSVWHGS